MLWTCTKIDSLGPDNDKGTTVMSAVLLQRMQLNVKAECTLTCIDEALAMSPAQSQ